MQRRHLLAELEVRSGLGQLFDAFRPWDITDLGPAFSTDICVIVRLVLDHKGVTDDAVHRFARFRLGNRGSLLGLARLSALQEGTEERTVFLQGLGASPNLEVFLAFDSETQEKLGLAVLHSALQRLQVLRGPAGECIAGRWVRRHVHLFGLEAHLLDRLCTLR